MSECIGVNFCRNWKPSLEKQCAYQVWYHCGIPNDDTLCSCPDGPQKWIERRCEPTMTEVLDEIKGLRSDIRGFLHEWKKTSGAGEPTTINISLDGKMAEAFKATRKP